MDSEKMKDPLQNHKGGEYAKFLPGVKIELAKYFAQHGVAATLRHHAPKYPSLKESTAY